MQLSLTGVGEQLWCSATSLGLVSDYNAFMPLRDGSSYDAVKPHWGGWAATVQLFLFIPVLWAYPRLVSNTNGDGVTFKNTPSQRVGGVSKGMRPEGLSRP